MGRHTTLKDVAQAAGVTTATVSYVINNTPGQTISPKTRERVLEAVAELGYMPNAHARTLRSRRISCVGVVIHKNLAVPRYSQMVYGIQERLEQRGYSVLLLGNTVGLQGYTDYVSAYLEGQIGGIIFIGTEDQTPDPDSIRILQNEHAPLVVFNCKQDADTYSTVDYDYAGGARLIAERVMSTGPKRLLYFEPQIDTEQERQREAWTTVQRGHAVANGLPVVAVNRVGKERDAVFWGSSFVAGPQGELLYRGPQDEEAEALVKVCMDRSEEVRRWWPFLRDRRIEEYGCLTKRFDDD